MTPNKAENKDHRSSQRAGQNEKQKRKQTNSSFKLWKKNHVKMAEIPLFFLFAYYSAYVGSCEQIHSCS